MYSVLILEKSEKKIIEIAKEIAKFYSEIDINIANNIDTAIEMINKVHPNIVVTNLALKDHNGIDLLGRLGKWEFQIMIYQDKSLYEIKNKTSLVQGYILNKID